MGPTAKDLRGRHAVVREEKPEAEDSLGENVEDGVADDLSIHRDVSGAIGNAPNARQSSATMQGASDVRTHIGYAVQSTNVYPAMAWKNLPVLASLAIAMERPWKASW